MEYTAFFVPPSNIFKDRTCSVFYNKELIKLRIVSKCSFLLKIDIKNKKKKILVFSWIFYFIISR